MKWKDIHRVRGMDRENPHVIHEKFDFSARIQNTGEFLKSTKLFKESNTTLPQDDTYNPANPDVKTKVLCLIDNYAWAAHNRIRVFRDYLGDRFIFNCRSIRDISQITEDELNNYDIVYVANWFFHHKYSHLISKERDYKLITTVCCHGEEMYKDTFEEIMSSYDVCTTSNQTLQKEVEPRLKIPVVYTPFGVDTRIFKKATDATHLRGKYVFVGNDTRPVKRYDEIQTAVTYIGKDLHVCNHESHLSREEMNEVYNKVGTNLCYSLSEGTPNPVLEAAATGRAVVSSPVGNVPKLFGKDYPLKPATNNFMFIKQVERLSRDKKLHKQCCDYLLQQVEDYWSWKHRIRPFEELFEG